METDKPTVDIVILTYGNYSGLERTIRSVLAQTQPIGTVVLSDDGSLRDIPATMIKLLHEGAFAVYVRQGQENLGTVAHANAVAWLMKSTYIKYLAVGDAFADCNSLKELVEFAAEQQSLVVTSDCIMCSEDLSRRFYRFPGTRRARCFQETGMTLFSTLACANWVSAAGTLFRREFFTEYGGFDETYHLLEDWPAWLRLSREGHRIPYLSKVTALYAMGGISSKDDNAYHAPRLREDMRRCYEREILPYLEQLSMHARYVIGYRYASLTDMPVRKLWRNYPLLCAKEAVKRRIKRCMTGSWTGIP